MKLNGPAEESCKTNTRAHRGAYDRLDYLQHLQQLRQFDQFVVPTVPFAVA